MDTYHSAFQFQLGPEKGVLHLAIAAIINALWDLWAKIENKPLWQLLTDMKPEVKRIHLFSFSNIMFHIRNC